MLPVGQFTAVATSYICMCGSRHAELLESPALQGRSGAARARGQIRGASRGAGRNALGETGKGFKGKEEGREGRGKALGMRRGA